MKNLSLLLLAVVGVLVGCSKNEAPDMPETPGAPREIRIASAIEATGETKAAMGPNTALNSVRFLRVDQAGTTPPTNFSTATALTADRATDGAVTFSSSAPIYKLNDDYAFFAAYWPVGTETTNTKAVWTIDGKTDILLSDVYNAGKYSAPVTGAGAGETAMALRHQLAQLEVICKADGASTTAETVVQAAWGKITKIELLNTEKTVTYTYADQRVAYTAPTAIALLQADYTNAFPSAGVDIKKTPSPAITAAGMFAPKPDTNTDKLTLKVYTSVVTAGKEVEVVLKDGATTKGFARGKKHTATLIFKANDKNITVSGTTIDAWDNGYSGSGDLNN